MKTFIMISIFDINSNSLTVIYIYNFKVYRYRHNNYIILSILRTYTIINRIYLYHSIIKELKIPLRHY